MDYGNASVRAAYVQGVRDAYDSVLITCPPALLRELEDWLGHDLEQWQGGEPPPSPSRWEAEPPERVQPDLDSVS